MNPVLKGVLIVSGVLAGLLASALVVVALTFDPNDYKAQIQQQVKTSTGRDLSLSGPLKLSVFPWLGVQAEQVSLSNAAGFTDPQFASLDALEVRLRLWPLLRKRIELGQVKLRGLALNLERRADGSSNWDDLGGERKEQAAPPPAEPAATLPELKVAGVEISNARIQWRDAGKLTVVDGLNLVTGAIAEGETSDLSLAVGVALADNTRIQLNLSSAWNLLLAGPMLSLDQFQAEILAQGGAVPAGEQRLKIGFDARYDGAAQTAQVAAGRLEFADQLISFNAALSDLSAAMKAQLQVEAKQFDLAQAARTLAVELPAQAKSWPALNLDLNSTAEPGADRVPQAVLDLEFGALRLKADAAISSIANQAGSGALQVMPLDLHAFVAQLGFPLGRTTSPAPSELSMNWTLGKERVAVDKLRGALAGEALAGTFSLEGFSAPVIRTSLDLAGLTVEDWLPAKDPAAEPDKQSEAGGDINTLELPMDWAKDLNLTARAGIARFHAYGVKFRDVLWTADARPGRPVKQKLSANAYGGQLAVDNSIDAGQPDPLLGLKLSVKALGLGELLQDGWGKRWISGTTELGLSLASQGKTVGKMRTSANGEASYRLQDGEMQGVSLVDVVRKASALLDGSSHTAQAQSTSFSELAGRALIESGKVRVQDLAGGNDWFAFAGQGFIDLLAGRYDLSLAPVLLKNAHTSSDKTLSKLIGLAIPIGVSGPLNAPKFKVDLEQVLKEKAKSELKGTLDKEKDKLRNKFNDKLGDFLRSR